MPTSRNAVAAFLAGEITFTQIVDIVEATVQKLGSQSPVNIRDISDVTAIENDAQNQARLLVQERR